MKVVLLYVASLDGKLTKWEQTTVHEWTSPEDAAHFQKIRDNSNLIVMGIQTFLDVQPTPTNGTLRIVMTKDADMYAKKTVPGQLEFSKELPEQLIKRLEKEGYKELLLVSGQKLTTAFFQKNLIDEVWITIEPKIFGTGKSLITEEPMDISLRLLSSKQLNENGTLLLHYKVL
jgi:dihydrofolate reductase